MTFAALLLFFWSFSAPGADLRCLALRYESGGSTLRPLDSYPIDRAKLEAWVDAHRPELRPIARFLAEHMRHIPHAEFEAKLLKIVETVVNRAQAENPGKRLTIAAFSAEVSSEHWIARLILEAKLRGALLPGVNLEFVDAYGKISEVREKDVLLIFDDALYSGTHLATRLPDLKAAGFRGRVYVGVPFATNFGRERISEMARISEIPAVVQNWENIPTVAELVTAANWSKSQRDLFEGNWLYNEAATLTYFDHKVAAAGPSTLATLDSIEGVLVGGVPANKNVPFIPQFQPIYRTPE
jgi:hypothetical protein